MTNDERIRIAVLEQYRRIDEYMSEKRGDQPGHFQAWKFEEIKQKVAQEKAKQEELLHNLKYQEKNVNLMMKARKRRHQDIIELNNMVSAAELPPQFLWMHDAVFMAEQPVENLDPDEVANTNVPRKWWEVYDGRRYLEEETFEATDLDDADRAAKLAKEWKNNEQLLD